MTTTTTRAMQLTNPDAIDITAIEAETRPLFRVPDKYAVRECTDGSRVVVYDSAEVDDYADLAAEVIETLQHFDEGAYGDDPAAVAEGWIRHGYDPLRAGEWLAVGVCDPDHADELAAAGYGPEDLREAFHGWATDESMAAFLNGDAD